MKIKLTRGLSSRQLPVAFALLLSAPFAMGIQPQSTPAQFDMTGIIESLTLDGGAGCPTPQSALTAPGSYNTQVTAGSGRAAMDCTATIVINGQNISLPANTVVTLPASFLTPYELFAFNPLCFAPAACTETGLATSDINGRLPGTYEASIQGNIVYNAAGAATLIAGMVKITQEDLNSGEGFINFINYATGELFVGGNSSVAPPDGVRIRINDPVGRYGRVAVAADPSDTFDARFAVDDGNPTISAETGYPMCIPRAAPAVPEADPLCPQSNRGPANVPSPNGTLVHLGTFAMDCSPAEIAANLAAVPPRPRCPVIIGAPTGFPSTLAGSDPTQQAPLEVGDYIHYKGNHETDASGSYIAAHTISANVGIYTQPGHDPAYMTQEVTIVGLGPTTGFTGLQEGRELFKVVGFTTDVGRVVDFGKVMTDPCNGTETVINIGFQFPNGSTLAGGGGAAGNVPLGRFRTQFLKGSTLGVSMIPATKEIRTEIRGSNPGLNAVPSAPLLAANGLVYGQYQAPVAEYIFPENLGFGSLPIVPNNFSTMQFLTLGHGPWNLYDPYGTIFSLGAPDPAPIQSQLAPWPGATPAPAGIPLATCVAGRPAPPVIQVQNLTASTGAAVTLNATSSFSPSGVPISTFNWTQTGGANVIPLDAAGIAQTAASTLSFTAPPAAGVLTFVVTVGDSNVPQNFSSKTVTVTVAGAVDTISAAAGTPTYKYKDGSWNLNFNSTDPTLTWKPTVEIYDGSGPGARLVRTFTSQDLSHTPLSNIWTYTIKTPVSPLTVVPPATLPVMSYKVTSDKGGQLGPFVITVK
jgi:hypothetical protein